MQTQLEFIPVGPRVPEQQVSPTKPYFPLTELICDAIRMEQGLIALDDMRANWRAGKYRGVPADRAKAEINDAVRRIRSGRCL